MQCPEPLCHGACEGIA